MTFLDFFSGIGGFRAGLEKCGMVCKGHCEIDKFADRSYRAIHELKEDEWFAEDITKVTPADLPRVNLWAGGFPCQDISVSGRQRGITGERSSLFFEIVRLLKGTPAEDRPEWLVFENVKNLLSVNQGWDFATVLYSLAEVGYYIEYGLLNSKFHGVPQNRERVYLVAYRHFRADSGRKVFPITASNGKNLKQLISGRQGTRVYDYIGISCTLMSEGGGFASKTGMYFINLCKENPTFTETTHCIKSRCCSSVTNHSEDNHNIFYGCRAVLTPDREKKRQDGRRFKECGEAAFCLNTQDRHGVYLCLCDHCEKLLSNQKDINNSHTNAKCDNAINPAFLKSTPYREQAEKKTVYPLGISCNQETPFTGYGRIRKLTPRECWRLQGFTDDMFDKAAAVNSDTQLYKQAGNSVTIPVVFQIGKKIMEIQTKLDNEVMICETEQ